MEDTYLVISGTGEGLYKEKMSKFISIAQPCRSADEALAIVKKVHNEYCDARHCCWAYMLGAERLEYRSNDDGEPSGTAGKPILGQINSFGVTDVVVCVVRYFGGIKLGTSGLIEAYREAARLALTEAPKEQRVIEEQITIKFEYPMMGEAMRIVKELDTNVLMQDFQISCRMTLSTPRSRMPALRQRIADTYGINIDE